MGWGRRGLFGDLEVLLFWVWHSRPKCTGFVSVNPATHLQFVRFPALTAYLSKILY